MAVQWMPPALRLWRMARKQRHLFPRVSMARRRSGTTDGRLPWRVTMKKTAITGLLITILLSISQGMASAQPQTTAPVMAQDVPLPRRVLMTYADSWRERTALMPGQTALAQAPAYLNVIALSFGKPDMVYPGGLDLKRTGYDYPFSGTLLRQAIALLKQRQPGTRVLLSIGGGSYLNWGRLNERAVAHLAHDLGVDGVDIDYEPDTTCALNGTGHIACPTDAAYIDIVTRLRRVLPRPLILSVAGWHVGAYGEGLYAKAQPTGSPHAGFMLGMLRSPAAAMLDLVSIDAYDAGTRYDPLQAFAAYRAIWKGPLALGVEVPMKGATGPFYTVARTQYLAQHVSTDPAGGMMVYSMLEPPDLNLPLAEHPTGGELEQAACRGLKLADCEDPPPLPPFQPAR